MKCNYSELKGRSLFPRHHGMFLEVLKRTKETSQKALGALADAKPHVPSTNHKRHGLPKPRAEYSSKALVSIYISARCHREVLRGCNVLGSCSKGRRFEFRQGHLIFLDSSWNSSVHPGKYGNSIVRTPVLLSLGYEYAGGTRRHLGR
jgi:hypothetical protein